MCGMRFLRLKLHPNENGSFSNPFQLQLPPTFQQRATTDLFKLKISFSVSSFSDFDSLFSILICESIIFELSDYFNKLYSEKICMYVNVCS